MGRKKKSSFFGGGRGVVAKEILSGQKPQAECDLCHRKRDPVNNTKGKEGSDPLECGRFYSLGPHLHFHYHCLLFSDGANQVGKDSEGLFGFLAPEANRVVNKSRATKCRNCGKGNATAKCQHASCAARFHYPCNVLAGGVHVFDSAMRAFCPKHVPKQSRSKVPLRVKERTCLACQDDIDEKEQRCLVSPCCGRLFHCLCLQKFANQTGHAHFSCPGCLIKDTFAKEAVRMGIYLPVQDASWENPDQEDFYEFTRMGRLHQHCDASDCSNPKGRENHLPGTPFEIVRCNLCGMKAVHIECGGLEKACPDYVCEDHEEGQQALRARSAKKGKRKVIKKAAPSKRVEEEQGTSTSASPIPTPSPVPSPSPRPSPTPSSTTSLSPSSSPSSSSDEVDDDVLLRELHLREERKGKEEEARRAEESDSDEIEILEELTPEQSRRRSQEFVASLNNASEMMRPLSAAAEEDDGDVDVDARERRPGPASKKRKKSSPFKNATARVDGPLPDNAVLVPFEEANGFKPAELPSITITSVSSLASAKKVSDFFQKRKEEEEKRKKREEQQRQREEEEKRKREEEEEKRRVEEEEQRRLLEEQRAREEAELQRRRQEEEDEERRRLEAVETVDLISSEEEEEEEEEIVEEGGIGFEPDEIITLD